MKKVFQQLHHSLKKNETVALCSIIESEGSTPRGSGARLLVTESGHLVGTVGGGNLEHSCIEAAKDAIATRKSIIQQYELSPKSAADIGMVCGGALKIMIQVIPAADVTWLALSKQIEEQFMQGGDAWLITQMAESGQHATWLQRKEYGQPDWSLQKIPSLQSKLRYRSLLLPGETITVIEPLTLSGQVIVFGGGHVAHALVPLLLTVNFRVAVYEDRAEFNGPERFPGASEWITASFEDISQHLTITEKDYIVIMTRGHLNDAIVLEQALRTPAQFVGMMGSGRKIASVRQRLTEAGFDDKQLDRVTMPIGLPISSETPAEIAVSVAAQLIRFRADHFMDKPNSTQPLS